MNRFQILVTACVFTAASAWGQAANQAAPAASSNSQQATQGAPQSGAQAQTGQTANGTSGTMPQVGAPAATSAKNMISGCMKRGFANYQLSDSATQTAYQIRGNGADMAQYENHVVQVKGIPDPQNTQNGRTVFYAQNVTDTGQTCGPVQQQMAGTTPAVGQTGGAAPTQNAPAPNTAAGGQATGATSQVGASQPNSTGTTSATSNQQNSAPGAPTDAAASGQSAAQGSVNANAAQRAEIGGQQGTLGVNNNTPDNSQTASQGGTSGAATGPVPQQQAGVEDKGTPQAGTPQTGMPQSEASQSTGAVSAPAGAASQSSGQSFQGCVEGSPNNLTLKADNGKKYRLQGDTTSVRPLVGHQVEITGEDFNGKAIQVNAARDVASTCSAK